MNLSLQKLVSQFEQDWNTGQKPDLERYLSQVSLTERAVLAAQLLPIEIEKRLLRSEQVDITRDYNYLEEDEKAIAKQILDDLALAAFSDKSPELDETLDTDPNPPVSVRDSSMKTMSHRFLPNEHTSTTIGNYKLLQKLGEGGMGEVWLAEQERPVRRQVALKLIKAGLDNKQIVARFEAERQALAMMNHPNIARVLDAGTTSDGAPYFVMELVRGIPFSKYCDQHKLSVNERLRLFIPVCQAIQHAHQKGIIHRDLKPSNVLVCLHDGKPVPKVIDFGLAKALQHQTKLTDKTLFTEFGQVVGTLQYMSPEQAEMNQLDIDTRTDVYSLGVILYELLTGSTPIDMQALRKQAILQVLATIRDLEPPRPSARLSSVTNEAASGISAQRQIDPSKLKQILQGELDWIVMKALEKNRSQRYATAEGLAGDIQNFLSGDVVTARPPSVSYRLSKYVRRNKGLVASAITMMSLLLGGLVGVSVFAWRAEKARLKAEEAEKKAEQGQQKLVTIAIDILETSSGPSIALIRDKLIALNRPDLITAELEKRYQLTEEPSRKTRLAVTLANFGEVKSDYLLSQIESIDGIEVDTFIEALRKDPASSIRKCKEAASRGTNKTQWRREARLALIALAIGDLELANDLCEFKGRTDHSSRTYFVEEFRNWGKYRVILETIRDPLNLNLRSALCLGAGQIPLSQIPLSERERIGGLAQSWLCLPDAPTHVAAAWLLRQWELPEPNTETSRQMVAERDWFVNSQGTPFVLVKPEHATMVKLRTGIPETPFWLATIEIRRQDFEQFINDNSYLSLKPPTEKVATYDQKSYNEACPTLQHPQQNLRFEHALMFCNWLSSKEGRKPVYRIEGKKTVKGSSGDREEDNWVLDTNADGYRLPTESEWDLACGAGTNTKWCCGNSEELLNRYCQIFPSTQAAACGFKLPNSWGFHDMHGNICEWVWVNNDPKSIGTLRGGNWSVESSKCCSQYYFPYTFTFGNTGFGFRVALNGPQVSQ